MRSIVTTAAYLSVALLVLGCRGEPNAIEQLTAQYKEYEAAGEKAMSELATSNALVERSLAELEQETASRNAACSAVRDQWVTLIADDTLGEFDAHVVDAMCARVISSAENVDAVLLESCAKRRTARTVDVSINRHGDYDDQEYVDALCKAAKMSGEDVPQRIFC